MTKTLEQTQREIDKAMKAERMIAFGWVFAMLVGIGLAVML